MQADLSRSLLAFAVVCLAGCVSLRAAYVKAHPELSTAHRDILLVGKVPEGDAAAGMTKEQVRLAMGSDPAQFTTVDGVDAWVYFTERGGDKASPEKPAHSGKGSAHSGGKFADQAKSDATTSSGTESGGGKTETTIFFNGDRATRVSVTRSWAAR